MHQEQLAMITVLFLLLMTQVEAADDDPVVLGSTLKQGSLCPGEDTATFTCSAVGTDLVWLVDGRTMAYNANAQVGALRSNALADQIAILMRVEIIANRVANRVSVLTITELPSAAEPTTVRCHNGSIHLAREKSFLRRVAGVLIQLTVHAMSPSQDGSRIYVNWTAPDLLNLQTIDYYLVQLDSALPRHTKNTSTILFVAEDTNHTIKVQAVDTCKQKGREHLIKLSPRTPIPSAAPTEAKTAMPHAYAVSKADFAATIHQYNGVRKGPELPSLQLLFQVVITYIFKS